MKKSLALRASNSDESGLDEEQVAFITKNSKKFFKKKGSGKKEIGNKK